ncbi:MAG TPA: aldo/keto reductase [Caulobacteraceae bacterium]|jgi:aryl-alcohol dehydrogenase-like predicted oxidoreductase
MRYAQLGPLGPVSRLTLGGGGLGRLWGETTAEEAIATTHAALDAGIDLIDTAPSYRDCEVVIGAAFEGAPPSHVRFTTKCQLGEPPRGEVAAHLETSLDASLSAMRLERVDVFFLHSNIRPDDYRYARFDDRRTGFSTPWSMYVEEVVPAMERLQASGRIGAWGITGTGIPEGILAAIAHDPVPSMVQAVANLMDSAGSMRAYAEPPRPREIIAAAKARGLGVLGIRAVQAGALTSSIDRALKDNHPEVVDYRLAESYRALCAELGEDPAVLAHRYALDMEGVDSVILGVKNRTELADCLRAEAAGPLPTDVRVRIDALGLAKP